METLIGKEAKLPDGQDVVVEEVADGIATVRRVHGARLVPAPTIKVCCRTISNRLVDGNSSECESKSLAGRDRLKVTLPHWLVTHLLN